jgi:hypothetical protein
MGGCPSGGGKKHEVQRASKSDSSVPRKDFSRADFSGSFLEMIPKREKGTASIVHERAMICIGKKGAGINFFPASSGFL